MLLNTKVNLNIKCNNWINRYRSLFGLFGCVTIYCIVLGFFLVLAFNSDYVWLSVVPVVTYVNADKEKEFAIKNNRKKSGIYR